MKLMQLALVHRSAKGTPGQNNERLELLGDSVLDMLAAEWLYARYPDKPEGFLAGARAEIVCTTNLAIVARRIKVGERLVLGRSMQGQLLTANLLADAVEAQIGAMYLTYGLDTVRKWCVREIFEYVCMY